jgi:hypothetical protein
MDDRTAAARYLDRLARIDQRAAEKLSYIRTGDASAARAGEAGQEELIWSE